jgi:hypothetical protein
MLFCQGNSWFENGVDSLSMLWGKKGSVVDGLHLHYLHVRVSNNLNAEEACSIQA